MLIIKYIGPETPYMNKGKLYLFHFYTLYLFHFYSK